MARLGYICDKCEIKMTLTETGPLTKKTLNGKFPLGIACISRACSGIMERVEVPNGEAV